MNAQEAIELTEDVLKLQKQTVVYGKFTKGDKYTQIAEALSIVLSMAKEYHELLISDENMRRVPLTGKDCGDALNRMFKSMEGPNQ